MLSGSLKFLDPFYQKFRSNVQHFEHCLMICLLIRHCKKVQDAPSMGSRLMCFSIWFQFLKVFIKLPKFLISLIRLFLQMFKVTQLDLRLTLNEVHQWILFFLKMTDDSLNCLNVSFNQTKERYFFRILYARISL